MFVVFALKRHPQHQQLYHRQTIVVVAAGKAANRIVITSEMIDVGASCAFLFSRCRVHLLLALHCCCGAPRHSARHHQRQAPRSRLGARAIR